MTMISAERGKISSDGSHVDAVGAVALLEGAEVLAHDVEELIQVLRTLEQQLRKPPGSHGLSPQPSTSGIYKIP
jgi:hypothetical protein